MDQEQSLVLSQTNKQETSFTLSGHFYNLRNSSAAKNPSFVSRVTLKSDLTSEYKSALTLLPHFTLGQHPNPFNFQTAEKADQSLISLNFSITPASKQMLSREKPNCNRKLIVTTSSEGSDNFGGNFEGLENFRMTLQRRDQTPEDEEIPFSPAKEGEIYIDE